ncbi:MAG TPA: AraC family transcriptional regulator [Longimicrobium sp.]|nr:AraC family transcriptional regulator [Longimicrobium sp.]
MEATVAWEGVGEQHHPAMEGCLEVRGRVVRGGTATRVVGGEHLILVAGAPSARMRHRCRVTPLQPGAILAVDTGDVVSVEIPWDSTFCALQVDPHLLSEVAWGIEALRPFLAGGGMGALLACCVAGDSARRYAEEAARSEDALRRFLGFVVHACSGRVRPAGHSGHAVVLRIRDYVREAYARTVTLDELGKRAGMCRFALARAFTREIGMPPHAYQTHVRVLNACELIRAGSSLSVVALDVGFSDQSHLCRHFKRILGLTPGTYAREVGCAKSFKPALPAAA